MVKRRKNNNKKKRNGKGFKENGRKARKINASTRAEGSRLHSSLNVKNEDWTPLLFFASAVISFVSNYYFLCLRLTLSATL